MPVQKKNSVNGVNGVHGLDEPEEWVVTPQVTISTDVETEGMLNIYYGHNETIMGAERLHLDGFAMIHDLWFPPGMIDLASFLRSIWEHEHFRAIGWIEDFMVAINDHVDLEDNNVHFLILQLDNEDPVELGVLDDDLIFVGSPGGYALQERDPLELRSTINQYNHEN